MPLPDLPCLQSQHLSPEWWFTKTAMPIAAEIFPPLQLAAIVAGDRLDRVLGKPLVKVLIDELGLLVAADDLIETGEPDMTCRM